jgi:hypothetical protein
MPYLGPTFFTPKFKGSGLRYEVALSIQEGDICWTYDPFPCGLFNDLQIFQRELKKELVLNEKVQADKIYGKEAPCYVRAPGNLYSARDPMVIAMEKKVRSRHEHVNKRFKQWSILQNVYRHDIVNHGDVFRAVSCMTQICIENGEPLDQVVYVD